MDNWLAKLASELPTNAENLEQALGELSLPALQELAQEQSLTPNTDSFEQKVAEADELGRELAHQHGPGLAAQAEQRALQNHAVVQSIQNLPEDEAIKLAFILEHGSEQEKRAGLASIAAKGLGAIKNMAGKAISSGAGQKAIHMGAKNPMAAAAVGGAAAGGVHSKATGGSFLGGAALGAGMGAGGAHLMGKGKVTGALGAASKWGKNQVKMASPLSGAIKAMVAHDLSKLAYLDDSKNEWLEQFEGTPLLEQALGMVQEELQAEVDSIQSRQEEDEHRRQQDQGPSSYHARDMLRAKKKMLELQLVAQRNGMGDPTGGGAEMPGAEQGQEEAPAEEAMETPAEEAAEQPDAPPMGAAQEQVKMAYARALQKTAAMPRIRMARDVRRAAAKAAGRAAPKASGAAPRAAESAAKGVASVAAKAKGIDKKKALMGAGVVGASAAAGGAIGNKKGKAKGRREGFGVGVRRGYVAGAQRGYAAGRSYNAKTASFT